MRIHGGCEAGRRPLRSFRFVKMICIVRVLVVMIGLVCFMGGGLGLVTPIRGSHDRTDYEQVKTSVDVRWKISEDIASGIKFKMAACSGEESVVLRSSLGRLISIYMRIGTGVMSLTVVNEISSTDNECLIFHMGTSYENARDGERALTYWELEQELKDSFWEVELWDEQKREEDDFLRGCRGMALPLKARAIIRLCG